MDAKAQGISRLTASPFTYAFGQASRYALFKDFFAEERFRARLHLSPPTDDRIRVALDVQEAGGLVASAAAGAALADRLPTGQLFEGCVTVGTSQPLTARGTLVDPARGLAAYARLPLSDSLHRRAEAVRPAHSAPGDPEPVLPASSLRGGSASQIVGRASNAFHVAGGDLTSITQPDDDEAGGGRSLEWPEVGAAWSSSKRDASAGLHAGLGPGKPLKAWVLGSRGGWSGGLQASLFADDAAAAVKSGAGLSFSTPFGGTGSVPVDVDVAVCLKSVPVFTAALVLESAKRQIKFAYQHHTTLRRKVYNPLEEAHVQGIFNYVDVGFEFRQPVDAGAEPSMDIAAAWQLNRHWMLKGKAGTAGVAASIATRAWSSPDFTLTATAGAAPPAGSSMLHSPGVPYAGVFLSFGNAAAPPTYRKAVIGEQTKAKYRQFSARGDLSASRSSHVESDSTQPGPSLRARSHMPPVTMDDDDIIPGRS